MRYLYIPAFVILSACATQDIAVNSGKARFSEYPESLFDAFRAACDGPAARFTKPTARTVECRQYLPPEVTAGLILGFDGTMNDLPQLVIRFTATADDPGYLVANDVYVNVPRADGSAQRIRHTDPRVARRLNRLYVRAGGVPE